MSKQDGEARARFDQLISMKVEENFSLSYNPPSSETDKRGIEKAELQEVSNK